MPDRAAADLPLGESPAGGPAAEAGAPRGEAGSGAATIASLEARLAGLERQLAGARTTQSQLIEALHALPQPLVILDAEDRFFFWNRRYAELYIGPDDGVRVGSRFEELLRAGLARGEYADADGREEAWLAARMARHACPRNRHEQQSGNGSWVQVDERRTASGGSVGLRTDITELKRREASFKLLFDANPVAMLVCDRGTLAILAANDQALATYGYPREDLLERTLQDLAPDLSFHDVTELMEGSPDAEAETVWAHRRADGSELLVRLRSASLVYEGREAALCSIFDLTSMRRVEDELIRTQMLLDSLIENIPLTVFAKDMADDGRYVVFNRAAEQLTGLSRVDVFGQTDLTMFGPVAGPRYRDQDQAIMRTGEEISIEEDCVWAQVPKRILTRKLPIAGRPGEAPRYILGLQEDVTERRQIESRLLQLAHHDALTDLANRTLFRERMRAALARQAAEDGPGFAVLLIDLDGFKQVNDTLGHQAGDLLLVKVAERLRLAMRQSDCAARLGGDEFAVLHEPGASAGEAMHLARRLTDLVGQPYLIEGKEITVGASVGLAFATGGRGRDADALLREADLALYQAKRGGGARVCLFGEELGASAHARRVLERDLRQALETEAFELHYQPFYSLSTRSICGFEALLRWNRPQHGFVPPLDFMPVAEEIGLVERIGHWVLREACLAAARWPAGLRVAVNLSATQIQSGAVADSVFAALQHAGLAPGRLELEITESVLLIAEPQSLSALHRLRAAGISVSLDDFGTGYSSLSYLHTLPFDRIKIDRSFVANLGDALGCLAVVRAVVGLSSSLGVRTTAEGIETPEQWQRIEAEGCDELQGFLISRPVPGAEIPALLAAPLPRPPAAPGA